MTALLDGKRFEAGHPETNGDSADCGAAGLRCQLLLISRLYPRLSSGGLGVGLEKTSDGLAFWHWSDNGAFKAYMLGFPDRKFGLVMLTNLAFHFVGALHGHLSCTRSSGL